MATANDWGLTDRGFRRPTYAELLDALELKAREQFGSQANLTVRSPLGIFLRIFAWILNLLFATIEDVYNSRFIDTAVGTSLYNLGRAIGLRLLPAQKAVGYLLISGGTGTVVPVGWLGATNAGMQYVVVAEGIIDDSGSVLLPAQATIPGPEGNTAENTITNIVNPMDGITSVTNPNLFDGGRNTETDPEYRERYYASVDFAGGVNIDAIAAEVLQNVEGIYSAIGYENDTDFTDEDGLPPHSFEIVAYGGLDEDVARQIFRRKAAGIQTYGNTTVPVFSASGQIFDISFSRPDPVQVYISITNLATNPSAFPSDGAEQITEALVKFIGGNVRGGLAIGEDVIFIRLPGVVFSAASGVIDFTLQISADSETFGENNIPVASREKAVTDAGSVTIE
jgi:uncharacterized phage protein gp47/JayE